MELKRDCPKYKSATDVGAVRRALGIPKDEKIPASKLKDKPGDSPAIKKKKLFARNARKFKHQDGGVITDKTGTHYNYEDLILSNQETQIEPIGQPIPTPNPQLLYKAPKITNVNQLPTYNNKPINWGNVALGSLAALNMFLTEDEINPPVVRPAQSYNPHPYGTGSQAIANDGITISNTGYKSNSKDRNKPSLRIPSSNITMKDVPFPILGTDNTGFQQIMLPNNDYQFPGEYVDEIPLAKKGKKMKKSPGKYISTSYEDGGELEYQKGGTVPTSADSLVLYNNALKVKNYYKSNPNYTFTELHAFGNRAHRENDDAYASTVNSPTYKHNTPTGFRTINPIEYRVNLDENKYLQRELAASQLDMRAPYQLFDRRIEPTGRILASNKNINDSLYGDQVLMYSYDPIAVKPWNMLTDAEKKVRIKKYGYPLGYQSTALSNQSPTKLKSIIAPRAPDLKTRIKPQAQKLLTQEDNFEVPYEQINTPQVGAPNLKTPWSFTYPDFQGANSQQTRYFGSEQEWRDFMGKQRTLSSQQTNSGGTATGYLKEYKKGGKLSPEKAREMLHDGTANGKKLTKKQKRYFGMVAAGKANDGLMIEDNEFTPLSDETLRIDGSSHENGGTNLAYAGKLIEAEAGETFHIDDEGNGVIMGNLKNPLTGNKFKKDSKTLAMKEKKINKLLDYSTTLVNESDPYDKWSNLKFNAGNAMMVNAKKKKNELASSRDHLSDLQEAMLSLKEDGDSDTLEELEALESAKNGLKIYQNGGTLAQRLNNPGNMMFANWEKKYGAEKGQPRYDKDGKLIGYFAKFPTVQHGQQAMLALLTGKGYKNLTVEQAANKWTGEGAYANIPSSLRNKKIANLSPQELKDTLDTFTIGEGSKKYNWEGINTPQPKNTIVPQTPVTIPPVSRPTIPTQPTNNPTGRLTPGNYDFTLNETPDIAVPTDTQGLQLTQILPEIYAAATNREEPVWMQQYDPQLFQDYNISLQDRRNRITSQGRASRQFLGDNAGAQAVLAAQEYDAISNVDAEEFRINQGIANDISNKNTALLNDAKLKNLQLADQQYVRQATGRSKTKATNQAVLNSISNKVLQNRLENRTLQIYENLYPHYRYNENYQLEKVGNSGADYLQPIPSPTPAPTNNSISTRYDNTGALKTTTISTPSNIDVSLKEAKLKKINNDNLQSLFKKGKYSKFGIPDVGINF